ncbi:MAG: sugar ABC transporter permease [Armatimonadetes bacterium]|nr:sugar ABC transporter permease [Armatimonadota bacterium]
MKRGTWAEYWRKNRVGLAFISPWLAGLALFVVWPFLSSLYLSFTKYDIVHTPRWVGPTNYQVLLTEDPLFWKSLQVTLSYAAAAVPLGAVVGVGLALLLNQRVRGMAFFRAAFYVPSVVPTVATSVVFLWILNPEIGLLNGLLKQIGIKGPAYLTDPNTALPSLVAMSLWSIGGSMVVYLAGLKDIPVHLYEAAMIDGTSAFQRMRTITLPLLTPVILFNVVMSVIGSFQYFTEAYVMTQGGPEQSTTFFALYLFQRAWQFLDLGYASAMAWILFVIVVAVTLAILKTQSKWVHYRE